MCDHQLILQRMRYFALYLIEIFKTLLDDVNGLHEVFFRNDKRRSESDAACR